MVAPPQPPAEQLKWTPVLAWRTRLADANFDPGRFDDGEELQPGVFSLPTAELSDDALAFIRCLYDQQVVAGFDWSGWLDEGGRQLAEDPERLVTASLEECRMLLTAHVRADRFMDGHLLAVLTNGHLLAILDRIGELTESEAGGGSP